MRSKVPAGITGGLVLLASLAACEDSPREGVILHAGATTLVDGGRVVVTLLDAENTYRISTADSLLVAHFRLRCDGQNHDLSVPAGSWSDTPCGIRLRVNEIFQKTLPAVDLDIEWE